MESAPAPTNSACLIGRRSQDDSGWGGNARNPSWARKRRAMAVRGAIKAILIAGAALCAFGFGVINAQAGGFTLRQSSYFQGASWAGVAAGGPSVSAMFWNPATITQAGLGLTAEGAATIDSPRSDITPTVATSPTRVNLTPFGGSGDLFDKATVRPEDVTESAVVRNVLFPGVEGQSDRRHADRGLEDQ